MDAVSFSYADDAHSRLDKKYQEAVSAPTNPKPGDDWMNPDTGIVYTYVSDGAEFVWLDLNGFGTFDLNLTKPNDFEFIAGAAETVFTLAYTPGYIEVYRNGARLFAEDYIALNSTTVEIPSTAEGDAIMVRAQNVYPLADTYSQDDVDAIIAQIYTKAEVDTAISNAQPIDEVVSHLASTGSTYVDGNLTEVVYITGNKEVLTYNGDNTLDEVKYYDTDGTTLMLTTKQIYNVGIWSHETRTEV